MCLSTKERVTFPTVVTTRRKHYKNADDTFLFYGKKVTKILYV